MIRTRMTYHRPASLAEAIELLGTHHGNIAVLGGGTTLLPRMGRGEVTVEHVLDISDLGLDRVTSDANGLRIGARVTYAQVMASRETAESAPVIQTMAAGVTGGRQITQQGTLVGSACFAFPTSDAPGLLAGVQATVELVGPNGPRSVPASAFFVDAFEIDRQPGELVTGFSVGSVPAGGYVKIKHSSGSWPIATATAVRESGDTVRVALGAVQAVPLVVHVRDGDPVDVIIRDAVARPWDDALAPGSYRTAIASVAARRAIERLEEEESTLTAGGR